MGSSLSSFKVNITTNGVNLFATSCYIDISLIFHCCKDISWFKCPKIFKEDKCTWWKFKKNFTSASFWAAAAPSSWQRQQQPWRSCRQPWQPAPPAPPCTRVSWGGTWPPPPAGWSWPPASSWGCSLGCERPEPGNFEMLSWLNELDLCGPFLTEWQPDLDYYSVKRSPHKSNSFRCESISKFAKFTKILNSKKQVKKLLFLGILLTLKCSHA